MTNLIVVAVTLILGTVFGWFLRSDRGSSWSSESHGPSIEQIRQLASLTVLHVPVADVQVYTLTGYTGGIQAAMVVKGDVEISTDLTTAKLETVDVDHRQAYVILPAPTAVRPRVDHERTRIYKIDRSGLWQMIPGDAGERDLVNKALQDAQRLVGEVGGQADLIDQARARTKDLIAGFFKALDWDVEIRWMDQRVAVPATIPAASTS